MFQPVSLPHRFRSAATGHELLPSWRELETAQQVQQALFPTDLPRPAGWDFAAECRPARAVAGDYHDLFEPQPGRLTLALGDVAGKGLGPALVTAGLHALVRRRLPGRLDDLPGVMAEINDYLLPATPEDFFVSLVLAVLDLDSGQLTYVNAGHPAPIVVRERVDLPLRLSPGGPVLGILPAARYEAGAMHLEPGCVLALFSDGIVDAANPCGGRFSQERLIGVLRDRDGAAAEVVLSRALESLDHFRGKAALGDDATLLIVRRFGERAGS